MSNGSAAAALQVAIDTADMVIRNLVAARDKLGDGYAAVAGADDYMNGVVGSLRATKEAIGTEGPDVLLHMCAGVTSNLDRGRHSLMNGRQSFDDAIAAATHLREECLSYMGKLQAP